MPVIYDLYPVATNTGTQVELDALTPVSLSTLAFTAGTGIAPVPNLVVAGDLVVFYSPVDCVVTFDTTATVNPSALLGFLLLGGERAVIIIPATATTISAVGLANSGILYINTMVKWAGLGNNTSGVI